MSTNGINDSEGGSIPPAADSGSAAVADQQPHSRLTHEERVALNKAALASFIGNFIEWFDYASYGYLAVIIGNVFFPNQIQKYS